MKKILSLVLALLLMLSMVPMVYAAEDPTEVSPYQDAVDFLSDDALNLYHGDGNGPAALENVTRWQMALFVSRFVTGETNDAFWETDENTSGFTDVDEFEGSCPATLGAISFASQKGIVNGIGGGLFDPANNVTYQDAIVMVVRALGFNYKSSGYPWSYINKARELGVLEGISGIGYTEDAPRGVIAQLLYNALFVEFTDENGNTYDIAGSVFGITKGIVMVTASQRVVYAASKKVTRSNCVEIKFLNGEGVPAGVAYYVSAKDLDSELTNNTKIDDAVGTTYYVYYADGRIIKSKSLSEVFWNNALTGQNQIAFGNNDANTGNGKVTVNGITYNLKSAYSDLQHANGTDYSSAKEMILYRTNADYGDGDYLGYSKYLVSSKGDIYDLTYSYVDPIVYYNWDLNLYYEKDGNGGFNILDYDYVQAKYIANAKVVSTGFGKLYNTKSDVVKLNMMGSQFMKIVVSDVGGSNGEKVAYIRNYTFGKIKKDGAKFTIWTGNNGNWGFNQIVPETDGYSEISGDYTGRSNLLVNGEQFAIYYVDTNKKTVDVLAVADAKVSGYLRGWNLTENIIQLDGTEYKYGYDTVKTPAINSGASAINLNKISFMTNKYVIAWMLDGKIVWMQTDDHKISDYIVADQIVAYGQDGIVVKAYTTVDNAYKEIKISQVNGWQLGGYDADYYLRFLAGIFTENQQNLMAPIHTYTIYRVLDVTENGYNVTVAGDLTGDPYKTNALFRVYDSDFITGVDNDGVFDPARLTTKKDSDYWIIVIPEYKLDAADEEYQPAMIINYAGKLSAVDLSGDPSGLDCYKWKTGDDHVFAATLKDDGTLVNPDLLTLFEDLTASNVEYVMYSYSPYNLGYSLVYNYGSAFGYQVLVYNYKDGAAEYVKLDPVKATSYYDESLQVIPMSAEGMEDGVIYVVSDGEILGKFGGELTDIVTKAYMPSDARNRADSMEKIHNIDELYVDSVVKYIAGQIALMRAEIDHMDAANPAYIALFYGNVTIHAPYVEKYYNDGGYETQVTRIGNAGAKWNKDSYANADGTKGSYVWANDKSIPTTGGMWTLAYIIDKDYKADVWVIPADASAESEATIVSYTVDGNPYDFSTFTASSVIDNVNNTATVTITLEEGRLLYDETKDASMTITEGASITVSDDGTYIASITIADVPADSDVTIASVGRGSGYGDFEFVVTP